MVIKTVLFDLDGTLVDTAPDLANALNHVLVEQGRPPLPYETIRPVVSHGGMALIRLGFGIEPDDPACEPLRHSLLQHYRTHIAHESRLFDGMPALLNEIETRQLNWGIVTNKPAWLTEPLLAALNLTERAATVVSGDTLKQCKPDPAPLYHACQEAGCTVAESIYVGDAERDIEAGRRAGMKTLVALFGYLGEDEQPTQWGADALINHPLEIVAHLA